MRLFLHCEQCCGIAGPWGGLPEPSPRHFTYRPLSTVKHLLIARVWDADGSRGVITAGTQPGIDWSQDATLACPIDDQLAGSAWTKLKGLCVGALWHPATLSRHDLRLNLPFFTVSGD